MQDEIRAIGDTINGLNTDVRALQIEVARLKVVVADLRAQLDTPHHGWTGQTEGHYHGLTLIKGGKTEPQGVEA